MDRNFNFVCNSFKLFYDLKNRQVKYINFLNNNTTTKNLIFSVIFTAVGLFLFYGAYITYANTKTNSMLNYSKIIEQKK